MWLTITISLFVASCTPDLSPQTLPATAFSTPELTLYRTHTPTQTPEEVDDLMPFPITPAPTATPFTHKVAKDETMLGIALKYGIKLEDLLAANPAVNPRMMSVDTILLIPLPVSESEPTLTVTPLPLLIGTPSCYPSADQNYTCLVEVRNTLTQAVENLSVWLGISDQDQLLASQVIYPALDQLPAGQRITLLADFPGPFSANLKPRARILTAVPVVEQDMRYLPTEFQLQQVDIASTGLQAQLTGQVSWQILQSPPGMIYVFATAFDASGNPVGVRKLEIRPVCSQTDPTVPCTLLELEMMVYSLGPEIHSIEVLVEARP